MITQAERDAIAAALNHSDNMFAVTLRYRGPRVAIDQMHRDIRDLQAKLDRKVLGRHFLQQPQQRSQYWAVIEDPNTNPHMHTAWTFRSLQHGLALIRMLNGGVWEDRYAPGGTHHYCPYRTDGHPSGNGWAGYACKALQCCNYVMISD